MTRIFPVFRLLAALGVALGVVACTPAPRAAGISDPHEALNRKVHDFNVKFDQQFFGPASEAYGEGVPGPVRARVRDFAANTTLPSVIVNDLLQGRIEDAGHNAVRFLFNTTIGLAGLFDVATGIGLEERPTDFGETLHVWGAEEGNYVVLPVFGPSTERDAVGIAVDFFTNPLSYVLEPPEKHLPTAANLLNRFDGRYEYAATVEDILYNSQDSYVTARMFYLDNRRFQLSGDETNREIYDIYDEAYE